MATATKRKTASTPKPRAPRAAKPKTAADRASAARDALAEAQAAVFAAEADAAREAEDSEPVELSSDERITRLEAAAAALATGNSSAAQDVLGVHL